MASKNIVAKGTTYNGVESVTFPTSPSGTATFFEVSDTTATASDVLNSKYFYTAAGVKTQGTGAAPSPTLITKSITANGTYDAEDDDADGYSSVTVSVSGGSSTLKMGVLRPDAELVQTWSYDKLIVQDEGATLPSYSTTGTTLKASENLTTSYAVDTANYDYMIIGRSLSIPVYSIATIGRGRAEYNMGVMVAEIYNAAPSFDNTASSNYAPAMLPYSTQLCVSWYSSSDLRSTTSNNGVPMPWAVPTISSGNITVKSPSMNIAGNSSYFSQTYFDATTDIRYQYIIQIYRAAKNSLNINGFNAKSLADHIVSCANSASGDLT